MTSEKIWLIIVLLGIGTFLIRFSFLGIIGGRNLPPSVLRYLRYVAVGIIPALVTPLVIWPGATQGETDPARLTAALAALLVGMLFNTVLGAIACGMLVLYAVQFLLG